MIRWMLTALVVGFLLVANGGAHLRLEDRTRALDRALAVGERQMETIERQTGQLQQQTEALNQCTAALEHAGKRGRPAKATAR